MKDKSLLNKYEYVWLSIIWSGLNYIWYRQFLFYPLAGSYSDFGKKLLPLLFVGFFFLNVFMTSFRDRTYSAALASSITPLGIYSFLAYRQVLPRIWIILALLCLLPGILFQIPLFFRSLPRNRNPRKVIRARVKRGFIALRRCLVIASLLLCAVIIFFSSDYKNASSFQLANNTLMQMELNDLAKNEYSYGDEYSFKSQAETMILLQETEWIRLDSSKRTEVLQALINCEARYLGLNRRILLQHGELEPNNLAHYNPATSIITINYNHMMNDDVQEVVNSICHECFHAAQYMYATLYRQLPEAYQKSYFLWSASSYADEFDNYINGADDYMAYHTQFLETDARAYARSSCGDIYYRIDKYLAEKEE